MRSAKSVQVKIKIPGAWWRWPGVARWTETVRWNNALTIQNYTTKTGNWQTVTKHDPCPICGKPDWCSRTADGKVVACRRVNNGEGIHKVDKQGRYRHTSKMEKVLKPRRNISPVSRTPAGRSNTLHRVYKEIISELTLSPVHKENDKRGFSDAEILTGNIEPSWARPVKNS